MISNNPNKQHVSSIPKTIELSDIDASIDPPKTKNNRVMNHRQFYSMKALPPTLKLDSPIKIKKTKSYKDSLPTNLKFLNDYLENEYANEDLHLTAEYFNSITIDEIVSGLFTILTIGNGIIYYETRTCGSKCEVYQDYQEKTEDLSLIFCSVSTLFYILNLIPKYYHYYKLNLVAKYVSVEFNFWKSSLFCTGIAECILSLLHPNLIFKDNYVVTSEKWNLKAIEYNINDFLLLITLLRLVYIIRIMLILSKFYGARSDRICKMFGKQLNLFFTLKCVFIKYSSLILSVISLVVCLCLAYMLKIIEGPNKEIDEADSSVYTNYFNCFWNVFVTITTVGFGDYYPKTFIGRGIIFFAALFGNIIVAMNINFLQAQTDINANERQALLFIERLIEREKMQTIAATYFKANFKYFVFKKKYIRKEVDDNPTNRKTLIRLAKNKFLKRKDFKKCLHRFQVKYKMPTDLDKVKDKINILTDNLENNDSRMEMIQQKIQAISDALKKIDLLNHEKHLSSSLASGDGIIEDKTSKP